MIAVENCETSTHAYRDVFESKSKDINRYLKEFSLLKDQTGVLVSINGEIKGMDTISSPIAYKILHENLLKVMQWKRS